MKLIVPKKVFILITFIIIITNSNDNIAMTYHDFATQRNTSNAPQQLLESSYQPFNAFNQKVSQVIQHFSVNKEETATFTSVPLVYPNPGRVQDKLRIQYFLNKMADIEMRLYDARGNKVLKKDFPMGTDGGKENMNEIWLTPSDFFGQNVSSGVYFAVFIHKGSEIGRAHV